MIAPQSPSAAGVKIKDFKVNKWAMNIRQYIVISEYIYWGPQGRKNLTEKKRVCYKKEAVKHHEWLSWSVRVVFEC